MSTSTVKVVGTAVVRGQPDEVEVQIELSHLDPSPDEALTEVARRSKALEGIFDELGIERANWRTSGVSVHERREWTGKQHIFKGFEAANLIGVRLADASVVGRLIQKATKHAHAKVSGPWWRIALDNPARVEACRQAAAEARRKAEAYASALGARLGPPIAVVEPELEGYRDRSYGMADYDASPAHAPELTVQAGELDIDARVVVTFALDASGMAT